MNQEDNDNFLDDQEYAQQVKTFSISKVLRECGDIYNLC